MSEVSLRFPLQGKVKLSQGQVRNYEKAYRKLKEDVVNEDKDTYTHQTQKLKEYLHQLQEIQQKAETNRQDCAKKIEKLRTDAAVYEKKVSTYEKDYKGTNKEADYRKKISSEEASYVNSCRKRLEIANSINFKKLMKIDIEERKSDANDVFLWIITVIYCEPQNKYYWPNFLEQALELDKGEDLRERLGKVNAFNAKEEQRVKTVAFLASYDKCIKAEELQKCQDQIKKIYEIAKIFLTCVETGTNVKQYEKLIEESKQEFQKGDEQHLQNRKDLEAIQQRIRVSELYMGQLNKIQNLANSKAKNYDDRIADANSYIREISSIDLKVPKTFVAAENEKRENCECNVM